MEMPRTETVSLCAVKRSPTYPGYVSWEGEDLNTRSTVLLPIELKLVLGSFSRRAGVKFLRDLLFR